MHSPFTAWLPLACGVALSLTTSDARADDGGIGHFNQQRTGDSRAGAVLGDFKSSRYAIGPQVGWFFPVDSAMGDVSLRGYGEFATDHPGPRAGTPDSSSASRSAPGAAH